MNSIVADTHAIIWYLDEPSRLSIPATNSLDAAVNTGNCYIYISAITLVEVQYLVEKSRIDEAVQLSIKKEIENAMPRILVYPLITEIVERMVQIPRSVVPDMPDRIIAATALSLGLPLVSCDGNIRKLSNVSIVW